MHKKTLKRTRKFVVDGVEVSVTTSKIISEDEKKDEEMRFLRQVGHWDGGGQSTEPGQGFLLHKQIQEWPKVLSFSVLVPLGQDNCPVWTSLLLAFPWLAEGLLYHVS